MARRARAMKPCGVALVVASLLALSGCTTPPSPQARRVSAEALAAERGWAAITLHAKYFVLAAWLPSTFVAADTLTLYLEGDGFAWAASNRPADDPTPITPTGLQLALAQPEGNAAYLARPCQYVSDARCTVRYWTEERFAPEIIAEMNLAVDALKQRFGASQLTLVGYSGGAAVAALLAARRRDVTRLVSVAGNLDQRAWTRLHRLTPLTGSLDPADERMRIAALPQWHFVGAADRNIPPALARDFVAGMPQAHVLVQEGYDHTCCWAEYWPKLWHGIR